MVPIGDQPVRFHAEVAHGVTKIGTASKDKSTEFRVAVLFSMFGPYHLARLNALADRCRLLGIEGAVASDTYAWNAQSGGERFKRVTLFEDAPISAQPAALIQDRLEAALDAFAPDAVLVPGWSESAAFAMLNWALDNEIPAIVMSESTAFDVERKWWREGVKRRVLRLFSAALVGGRHHVDYLEQLGFQPDRISTGYDAIDNEYFARSVSTARQSHQNARARLGLSNAYFLASARFVERKNISRLIDAFAHYRRQGGSQPWELVILGDGQLRSVLQQKIVGYGLEKAVSMPGFKQYDELPMYYAFAGAFIHASTSEQWGLVVNEAAASGLPVIGSNRVGCVPELAVDGENAFVFDPENVDALAHAMTRLAAGDCHRAKMGEKSRTLVSKLGPKAFGDGAIQAVETAIGAPRVAFGPSDRAIIAYLRRTRNSYLSRSRSPNPPPRAIRPA